MNRKAAILLLLCACDRPAETPDAPGTAAPPATGAAPADGAPPSLALPAEIPHFDAHEVCREGTCNAALSLSEPAPARMWEQEIAVGAKVAFPRDDALSIVGVVLGGDVALERDDPIPIGGAPPLPKKPLEGFYYRGAGVTLSAPNAGARVLVAVVAQRGAAVFKAKGARWETRPGANLGVRDFRLAGSELRWGGGGFGAVIGLEDGEGFTPDASTTLLGIAAPAGVPEHVHAAEWELIGIVSGFGTMTVGAGGAGAREVKPGTLVAIPKNTPHAFKPTKTPVLAIQMYVPPGPEQRFKKLAAEGGP